ncbi:hypothetical protein RFI_23635 [Reticulomyxa filosa]|uniref:Cation efflux protein transmembrane domain-containing protein n=1 Tax=Reticulomyxa filosa TaxID=46433 RepID=X6MI95_RETFI|nr:hypothetical protein RFI_23635 [Reticulomyxa filosa]|eukprot:ETO13733.1 hypothetical protein RFI_23635 [Reticulomyxa filosa]
MIVHFKNVFEYNKKGHLNQFSHLNILQFFFTSCQKTFLNILFVLKCFQQTKREKKQHPDGMYLSIFSNCIIIQYSIKIYGKLNYIEYYQFVSKTEKTKLTFREEKKMNLLEEGTEKKARNEPAVKAKDERNGQEQKVVEDNLTKETGQEARSGMASEPIKKVHSDKPAAWKEVSQATDASNRMKWVTSLSLGANILLFIAKAVVFGISLSLSVLASLTDSLLDLVTQVIMFWTERQVRSMSPNYPVVKCANKSKFFGFFVILFIFVRFFFFFFFLNIFIIMYIRIRGCMLINQYKGKTRLEPVAIMGVSMLMVMISVIVIRESIATLVAQSYDVSLDIYMIVVLTFVIYSPIANALAEDHLNDVCSNSIAIIAVSVASHVHSVPWLDAVGGIVISLYIIIRWLQIARVEIKKLVGKRADDSAIHEIRLVCEQHSADISIDVLRAYHVGRNLLVEIEVVMDRCTTLEYVHDISLGLQKKVENFPYVERAFVHVDYAKRSYDEHKRPYLQ